MLGEKTFTTGDVVLNFAEGPSSGLPLVLLHGLSWSWHIFLPIMPKLVLKWQVYALDFRGHGKSGRTPGRYRLKDFTEDVTFFLNSLEEPAVLFGHSLGGWVAIMAAVQYPEVVRALILGDSPLPRQDFFETFRHYRGTLQGWYENASMSLEELIPLLGDRIDSAGVPYRARTLSQLDPNCLLDWVNGCKSEVDFHKLFEGYDDIELLSRISCPVLLLQGGPSHRGVMKYSTIHEALELLPRAYHVRLEDSGHYLGLDTGEVEPLLGAVTNFLESL